MTFRLVRPAGLLTLLLTRVAAAAGSAPPVWRIMRRWLRTNGDAIYGTGTGPFAHLSWGVAEVQLYRPE